MPVRIRRETPADAAAIHRVVASAFPTDAEARLVDDLRRDGDLRVSLVAVGEDGRIVGHVAFSPVVTAGRSHDRDHGIGLAPVAVLDAYRRRGIGAQLIEAGLAASRENKYAYAVVLGSPAYYSRFGFEPASTFGLADEYGGGDAFQVMALVRGGIPHGGGLVRYATAFSALE